jgi:chromate transport protein ChrA
VIFIFVAVGASQLGAAVGRSTGQRLVGILVTIIAVLASLLAIGILTAGTCSS